MGLKNTQGRDLKDIWAEDGIQTYLGITIHGFPNTFMSYSSQCDNFIHQRSNAADCFVAPTTQANGTTILECQVDFVVDAIHKLETEGVKTIEPTFQAQTAWCEKINEMCGKTLLPMTNSWWTAGNIPGKKAQMLAYTQGIPQYEKDCRDTLQGWKGFDIQIAS